ncbi:hypothetical protein BGZ94_006456 [Podila epigama]|nr:hypothetical protein BGZ94_006456 [Podila epigama]
MSSTVPQNDISEPNTSLAGAVTTLSATSTSTVNPVNTLNSSLKRIRLNDSRDEHNNSRGSDESLESGVVDLTKDSDKNDAMLETGLPSPKKVRRTVDSNTKEEEEDDDMDDFAGSSRTTAVQENTARPVGSLFTMISTQTSSSTTSSSASTNNNNSNSNSSGSSNIHHTSQSTSSATKSSFTTTTTKTFTTSKPSKASRTGNGMEDVFTHEQVRSWSEVRIKTWEHRRTNTEGFYYRFVDPTEGQQNGAWSKKSHQEFMERLEEWKARGIRIGTSWGVFSIGVSHKAGYQCSSYYRKLLENKTLTDPAYAWENGKLVMVQKSSGGEMAHSGLSTRWDTEEVKEIEANITRWIKEYHSNGSAGRLTAVPKTKRVESGGSSASTPKTTTTTVTRVTGGMFRPTTEAPRVKATTAPAVPKALSLRPSKQPISESEMIPVVNIDDKLAEYSSFMRKSTSTSSGPNKIRQSISLTVPATVHTATSIPARGVVPIEVRKSPLATSTTKGQTGLSLFWKNIRPARVECPDSLIAKYIIPKDVELRPTWAHRIQPVTEQQDDESMVAGSIHKEVRNMATFDWASLSTDFDEPVNDIQGIMADPPWNFIVEDGRNDGACRLTTKAFGKIMEKALELMPSGIACVWTHKAILPEVVSIMHGLGCRYVENLVWYKIALNNTNLDRASPYFRTSKEILLMFKKGDGFDIRHQRTADVIMDYEKPTSTWIEEDYTEPKPAAVYEMMEILLPDARHMPEAGRGRLLEIWAKNDPEYRRPGWFSVHEVKGGDVSDDVESGEGEEGEGKKAADVEQPEEEMTKVEMKDKEDNGMVIEIRDDDSDEKSDDLDVLLRQDPDALEETLRDAEMDLDA